MSPVDFPLDNQLMSIVGKAIEGGVSHNGIVEERHPFVDVAVAGENRRGPSVLRSGA